MPRGKTSNTKEHEKQIIIYELIGIALVALALIIFVSIYAMSQDYVTYNSNPGAIGGFLVKIAASLMGKGKILLPFTLLYIGYRYIKDNIGIKYDLRTLGAMLLLASILIVLHINVEFINVADNIKSGLHGQGGGILGALLIVIFRTFFGLWGTWIISGAFFIAGIILTSGFSLKKMLGKAKNKTKSAWEKNKDTLFDMLFVEEEISTTSSNSLPRKEEQLPPIIKQKNILIDMSDFKSKKNMRLEDKSKVSFIDDSKKIQIQESEAQNLEQEDFNNEKSEEKEHEIESLKEVLPNTEPNNDDTNFKLPPLSLLDAQTKKNKNSHKNINEKAITLERVLENFGINAKVTQITCGPAVTRFELDTPPGVKISKIIGLSPDIALNMAAESVRVAPIPENASIGIEVPNKEISAVSFREVLEDENYQKSSSKLTFALGKDISGKTVVADLAKMPHLLIAGTTGSGKSVCMNTLICSILFKATPKEVRLIMIDPKMVELAAYNGIPHLLAPVVTDIKKVAGVLKWIVAEMENRYEMFAQSGVKDIIRYNNQKIANGNELQTMPYYVIIIDELADLMMVARQDVEDSICRLAQMARAAGIHLVVATQRPSVDVITGVIKANIPSRIAFAVSSQTDSRTILDVAGAEKLLGRGDMLFHPVGEPNPLRIQGAFVSDREVENIVNFLKNTTKQEYENKILEIENVKTDDAKISQEGEDDPYFYDAGKILIETGQASISMLQRRLRIGYSRAARLIDMLEARGVVGGYEGSKPRNILMTLEEFEAMFLKKDD